jgi:hypothetical protein
MYYACINIYYHCKIIYNICMLHFKYLCLVTFVTCIWQLSVYMFLFEQNTTLCLNFYDMYSMYTEIKCNYIELRRRQTSREQPMNYDVRVIRSWTSWWFIHVMYEACIDNSSATKVKKTAPILWRANQNSHKSNHHKSILFRRIHGPG